ncbi:DUF2971 domain-containing protein [uncultured Novosphingobium sp.]|uniref:DUF2971 domain-containing protein n=1 Tax=uncultured Novosphingobium sp. TaxID=292277 RepID=UPI00258760C2|nr:DUF2971 domain-containing protein [uncultured Novosphingobium sp.]
MLELFFAYDRKRVAEVKAESKLVAHYTTADTAMKIITGRSMWLRNVAVMNDWSEVSYGRAMIEPVLSGPEGQRFRAVLDGIQEGLSEQVIGSYHACLNNAREIYFTASLSEHHPSERFGRLSMWRAYGGPIAGVALLFKGDVVDLELEPTLELAASPVLYGTADQFQLEFGNMVYGLEADIEFLKAYEDKAGMTAAASALLQYSMLSIKHPAFSEEREWRIVHRPYEFGCEVVKGETVTLGGIPQTIFKLPFHNPDKGFEHPQLNLNDILVGVMLGPCAYPETVFRAFVAEMTAAGIENAASRIFPTHIPLRQQV